MQIISYKGLVFRIHIFKISWNLIRKQKPNFKNRQKLWTDTSAKKICTEAWKRTRCSTLLVIWTQELKPQGHHYKPVWGGRGTLSDKPKCRRVCGLTGTFIHCWWECIIIQPRGKNLAVSYKVKHILTTSPKSHY